MKVRISQIPLVATTIVCLLLYAASALAFPGFFSLGVFVNFFTDNAVLGIAAIGMTFVILSGGIDLSVGAVIGFTSILLACLIEKHHVHPFLATALLLVWGTLFGAGMGCLVHFYNLPPFLVTLAGMFLARGLGFVMQLESIPITHPIYNAVSNLHLPLGKSTEAPAIAIFYVLLMLGAWDLAQLTRFGRNIYAVGGSESSAILMGLPVGRTKIGVYALSGLCSTIAGIVYTFYTFSGNPSAGAGLELDAIAAVVIGGTLLSGGIGHIAGTWIGVLILGIIQTAITFQGKLSSWWTKIAVGLLLLGFILLQKLIQKRTPGGRSS